MENGKAMYFRPYPTTVLFCQNCFFPKKFPPRYMETQPRHSGKLTHIYSYIHIPIYKHTCIHINISIVFSLGLSLSSLSVVHDPFALWILDFWPHHDATIPPHPLPHPSSQSVSRVPLLIFHFHFTPWSHTGFQLVYDIDTKRFH